MHVRVSIDATVMFADLRNYTALSQSPPPDAMSKLLDTFYDVRQRDLGTGWAAE
jgi:class 3 adenylate cyclase